MSILLVTEISDRSEVFLYCELARRGHRVTLVCNPNEPQIERYEAAGAVVVPIAISSRISPGAVRKLRRVITDHKIETVYAPFNKGLAAATLASIGLSCRRFTYRGTLGNLSRFNPTTYLTHLSGSLTGIICNCQAVKEDLVRFGLPEEKLTVVRKGHKPKWYEVDPIKDIGNYFEPPFNIRPTICCVANIRPLKGGDVLLSALSMIPEDRRPNLLFVGENNHPALLELTKKLRLQDQVRFLGFRKDALSIISSCATLVLPSKRREGFSRAVIDSVFVKTPAIVSNVGGSPEIIEGQKGGLVVPPSDSLALAKAIEKILVNPELAKSFTEFSYNKLHKLLEMENYIKLMESILTAKN